MQIILMAQIMPQEILLISLLLAQDLIRVQHLKEETVREAAAADLILMIFKLPVKEASAKMKMMNMKISLE